MSPAQKKVSSPHIILLIWIQNARKIKVTLKKFIIDIRSPLNMSHLVDNAKCAKCAMLNKLFQLSSSKNTSTYAHTVSGCFIIIISFYIFNRMS